MAAGRHTVRSGRSSSPTSLRFAPNRKSTRHRFIESCANLWPPPERLNREGTQARQSRNQSSLTIRTTISQNLPTPRRFFLVVLVLVLVLDWVSGLDYE